jgi:plastocyanin
MPANDDDGGGNNYSRSYSGFTMLAATLAVLLSMTALLAVAFKLDHSGGTQAASAAATSAAATPGVESVTLVVKTDEEHGKKGPEGTWHDAFLPADFTVKAGSTVRVTVYNHDEGPHSFYSPQLGTNATIPAGSEKSPSKTTFTFHAPQKAGSYEWYCTMPCDPWAMEHLGYMKGDVKVV